MTIHPWIIGTQVTWRAHSAAQRAAQEQFNDWRVATEQPYTLISGETYVLVAPRDRMHMVFLVPPAFVKVVEPEIVETEPESIRCGGELAYDTSAYAA
jgi:hypothetical protein